MALFLANQIFQHMNLGIAIQSLFKTGLLAKDPLYFFFATVEICLCNYLAPSICCVALEMVNTKPTESIYIQGISVSDLDCFLYTKCILMFY